MTNGGDDNDLLRLDVVDSVPSKPSEQAKSTSLSKCPVFPTYVLYFNFQSDDTRWGNKDVDLRHDGLDLDTFKTRLQGAEGVTFGKQNTDHQNHGVRKLNLRQYPYRKGRFRQTTHEHLNHGERQIKPCCIRSLTRASPQLPLQLRA